MMGWGPGGTGAGREEEGVLKYTNDLGGEVKDSVKIKEFDTNYQITSNIYI